MKKLFIAVALAAVPLFSFAEDSVKQANFGYNYNVDATDLTYCKLTGQNDDPFGGSMSGPGLAATSGSSATVTDPGNASSFDALSVGDVMEFRSNITGVVSYRVVSAKASANSLTVDSAITLGATGVPWRWLKLVCGTTAADGWIGVEGASTVYLTSQFEQGDITGLVVRWECRAGGLGGEEVVVYPGVASDCGYGTLATDRCSWAAAAAGTYAARLTIAVDGGAYSQCRIGVAYTGADPSDATTNRESWVGIIGVVRVRP